MLFDFFLQPDCCYPFRRRREEKWLTDKHTAYPTYAAAVPRFFPGPAVFASALPAFNRRSLTAAAAVLVLAALYAFLLNQ